MPPLQVAASQQISENVTSLAKQQRARILPPFLAGGGAEGPRGERHLVGHVCSCRAKLAEIGRASRLFWLARLGAFNCASVWPPLFTTHLTTFSGYPLNFI